MAIYKLGDLCEIKVGITPSTKNNTFWENANIPFFGPGEILDINNPKRFISEKYGKFFRKGSTLFSSLATVGNVAFLKEKSWFNQQITGFIPNNMYLLDKFLYYFLLSNSKKITSLYASGSIFDSISIEDFKKIKIDLPSLETQRSIISIIEPIEKIRNILEMKKNKINKILNHISSFLKSQTSNKSENLEIKTGKYNNDVVYEKGKYNFFSCSKEIKKSDKNSFKGKYIILSGNGELYTWWYEGEFDLYQRVYAIKPYNDFFTHLISFENFLINLRTKSSGSVIKYIKLEDIKSIPIFSNFLEKELEKIYQIYSNIEKIQEKINNLIKLIVNTLI